MFVCLQKTLEHFPPKATLVTGKSNVDVDTLKAILTHRFQIMADYRKKVITPVLQEERVRAKKQNSSLLHRAKMLLTRETSLVDAKNQNTLSMVLEHHPKLKMVYQARLALQHIWAKSTAAQNTLLELLQEWCKRAEESGVEVLRDFVMHLKAHV